MEPDSLEKVLSRVAQLFDKQRKIDLLRMLENDEGRIPLNVCPSCVYHASITKGALVAEVVYREMTGNIRNRVKWHCDSQ